MIGRNIGRPVFGQQPLDELLLQALQVELGCIDVHAAAMAMVDGELAQAWAEALDGARAQRDRVLHALAELGVDPDTMTPARRLALHHGDSLVQALSMVQQDGNPAAMRIVAGECVALVQKMAGQCRERVAARRRDESRKREPRAGVLRFAARSAAA